MASTTEELSSQAEQLKATIAFFSLESGRRQMQLPRPVHHAPAKQLAIGHAPHVASAPRPAAEPRPSKAPKAGKGIHLNLGVTGGADHLDEEFEKF